MTEERYVEELWAYDDIMVKDNESGEELWNSMIYERMNEQDEKIRELEKENKHLQCKIESNSQDDYIDYLKKENEQLKNFIKKLTDNTGQIKLMNGYGYHISEAIKNE